MKPLALACAIVLAALSGCSSGSESRPPPTPSSNRPSSTARIKILQPKPGEVVKGASYKVKVQVTGARVLVEASTDVRPDTGHVHLALDGNTVTLLAGLEFELTKLTPGSHLLQAEFSAADHG